jgi:hypothetical protein
VLISTVEDISSLEGRSTGAGNSLVLTAAAAADTNGADDRSAAPQWNAAGEDHHAPVIGSVDAKELLARLAVFGELCSLDIESARRERFVDRDIDAADPGAIHSYMTHEISTSIDNGNVHRLADFARFGFRGGGYAARITESDHDIVLQF